MVGPTLTEADRTALNRRLLAGVTLLVGASGGLVALQAGGDGAQVAAGAGVGLAIGGALSWYLGRLGGEIGL